MTKCLFCQIAAGKIPSNQIYQDEQAFVFLDIAPVNPGHLLIISKKHYPNLISLPVEILRHLTAVAQKIAPAALEAVGAPGFNLTVNNGSEAGQAVNHFHWHLIPRFAGDGRKLWPGREAASEDLVKIAEKIKTKIG